MNIAMMWYGVFLTILGLSMVCIGINAQIPWPDKGYHFLSAQDGYVVRSYILAGSKYENGDDVNILTFEKEAK